MYIGFGLGDHDELEVDQSSVDLCLVYETTACLGRSCLGTLLEAVKVLSKERFQALGWETLHEVIRGLEKDQLCSPHLRLCDARNEPFFCWLLLLAGLLLPSGGLASPSHAEFEVQCP